MSNKVVAVVVLLAAAFGATPFAAGLNEGFDGTTFPPSGWSRYSFDASTKPKEMWYRTTERARVYNNSAGAADINRSGKGNNDWLISP